MANTDKDIVITPNKGQAANPTIVVTGADNAPGTLTVNSDGSLTFDKAFTLNGNITFNGPVTTVNQARGIFWTGYDKEGTTDFSDTAHIRHTVNIGGHTGSVLEISSQNDTTDGIAFTTNASSQLRHNGHIVWDAGNDGSGSGLDADLLDGVQGASFLRSDANDSFTGSLTMSTQTALIASNYGHGVYGLYNAARYQHVWSMGAAYNLPADGTSTGLGGNLYGLAWAYNPDYSTPGTNAQAKAGLNHQLLLMMNGTTYFAAGAGFWTSGIGLSTASLRAPIFYDSNNTAYYVDPASTSVVNLVDLEGSIRHNGDTDTYIQFHADNQWRVVTGGVERLEVNDTNTTIANNLIVSGTINRNPVLTLSGDASGSATFTNLGNATLSVTVTDDSHEHTRLASATVGTNPDNSLEYFQISGNTTIHPTTDWYNSIRMGHGDPVTYYSNTLAIKMTGSNPGDIYTRTISNGTAQSWNRFWHNNNDGSGSGLDADLLDGQQLSDLDNRYVNTTGDTMTGDLTIFRSGVDTSLTIQGNNSFDPVITLKSDQGAITTEGAQIWYDNSVGDLHIHTTYPSDVASIRFYTRTGTNKGQTNERLRIIGSGPVQSYVDFRAPIFYDSNNTAYYVDAASTSVLNALTVNSINGHPVVNGDEFKWRGTGALTSTTTANLLTELLNKDVFDSYVSAFKTSWSYAGNGDLTDAGNLKELAGTSWLTWTDNSADNVQGNFTALVIAPNTGASANGVFIYNNQGSGYSPGWRELYTNKSPRIDATIFYDSNDSSYYVDPNGTTRLNNLYIVGGVGGVSNSSSYTEAAIEVRERGFGGAQDDTWATAPRVSFHWGGRVASQIAISSNGWINILNNPGNAYENFRAANIYATGEVTAYYSDERLKTILGPIETPIEKIKQIKTFRYVNNNIAKSFGFENDDIQIGVSAQSVETVLPEIVKHAPFDIDSKNGKETSKTGEWYKTVQYERLVPLLIEAVKEQNTKIERLEKLVEQLMNNK